MKDPWLYIVLLGLVIVVYARFTAKPGTGARPERLIREMEETMEHFSAELEEENRRLLELVSEMKLNNELHAAKLQGRIEALEERDKAMTEQLAELLHAEKARKAGALAERQAPTETGRTLQAVAADAPETNVGDGSGGHARPASGMEDSNIRTRFADVFQLYNQGKSTDYIARKLGMNKGEVMLIIQLAKQEEQALV